MFVLAHISDVHLPLDGRPGTRELIGKRILGYANWRRGRDEVHRAEVLEKITAHMLAQRPDHIAVTGDLVNVASAREWSGARVFLDSLGDTGSVTALPGNHDAYIGGSVPAMIAAFAPNMRGDTDAESEQFRATGSPALPYRNLDDRFSVCAPARQYRACGLLNCRAHGPVHGHGMAWHQPTGKA
jgi:3',5'-cyclic AMP phosphodiesterase CpdA